MWLLGISFILIGMFFGIFIGGHMAVDSCTNDIKENVMFRHLIEHIIKIRNDKEKKRNYE